MTAASFAHDAFFFDSDDTFVETLIPFLREGLARNEGAAVASTPARIALLREGLADEADAVTFMDRDEWYARPARTIAGWTKLLDASRRDGHAFTRVVGEVQFGSERTEHTTWTRYESALNDVFAADPAWIVCPYDVRALPDAVLEHAERTHPTLWRDGRTPSLAYAQPSDFLSSMLEPFPEAAGAPILDVDLAGAPAQVRALVRDALASSLRGERLDDLLMCVTEAATNAMRHGRSPRGLRLWASAERILCEVHDGGGGWRDQLAGYRPPAGAATGGMGLWIVAQLADAFAARSDASGTSVRFAIDL